MAQILLPDRNSIESDPSTPTTRWMRPFDSLQWNNPLDYIDRSIIIAKDCPRKIQTVKDNPHSGKRSYSDLSKFNISTQPTNQQSQKVSKSLNTLNQILQKAYYTIDRIQSSVRSITFRFLHERRITPRQAELYYSKNVLNNMADLFIETLNQIKHYNLLLPEELESYQQKLVGYFDENLSQAIEASSQYYSRMLRTPITLKMQQAIQPVSRMPNAKADIISMQGINLAKCIQYRKEEMINTTVIYSEFVTKVINASWTIVSNKNPTNQQNFADKFIKFTERLYASSQHIQYQKMVQQISKNVYNAERQTINLFLQILEDRELIKEMAVKEKGRGLEYMVSKIKFQSLDKYQKIKRNTKSQKDIVCEPLPTGWSQAKRLEIMQEWIAQLEYIFDYPSKHIFKHTLFKNVENNEISLCKEAKLKLIKNIEGQRQNMKMQVDQLLKNFRSVQGYLLKTSRNQQYQSKIGCLGAISSQSMVDLMNQYLCILIHHLLLAGNHIETRLGKEHVNLVSFTPSTLLSSKIQCNETTLITILNTLTMLDQSYECLYKFKLLQLRNNFNEGSNSLNIKFLLGETVKCSLELCFIENGFKSIYYSHFSNFLKKISGFQFGALASCAMLFSQNQGVSMDKRQPHTGKKRKRQKLAIYPEKKISSTIHIKNSTMFICINCQKLVVGDPNQDFNQKQTFCNSCIMKFNPKLVQSYVASKLKIDSYCVSQINDQTRLQNCNVIGLDCKTLQITPFKACFDEFQNENEINVIDEELLNLLNRKMPIERLNSRVLNFKELNSPNNMYFQIKGESLADILRNLYIFHSKENISYFQIKFREYQKKKQIRRLIEEQADVIDFNQNRENYSYLLEYLEETKLMKEERSKSVKNLLKILHLPTIHLQKLDNPIMMLTNLQKIDLRDNKLKNVDMSPFKGLSHLNANHNELTAIELKNNRQLSILQLNLNQLRTISLSNNINLTHLDLSHNQLKEISLITNPILKKLLLCHNYINTNIDLSKCPQLNHLDLSYNNLTAIKLQKNWNITYINLSYNDIRTLDVKNLTNLTTLIMSNAHLQKLDISSNPKLSRLILGFNRLNFLDVKNNPQLIQLNLDSNKFPTINLHENYQLTSLSMQNNELKMLDLQMNHNLQKLDLRINGLAQIYLGKNVNLRQIYLNRNQLTGIDLSNNKKLNEIHLASNFLTQIDLSEAKKLQILDLKNNQLSYMTLTYYYKAKPEDFTLSQKGKSCTIVIISSLKHNQKFMKFIQQLKERYQQLTFKHDFFEQ